MTGEAGTGPERAGRRARAAGSSGAAAGLRVWRTRPARPGPSVALARTVVGALVAALACAAMAAMAASAWAQDEHPTGTLTNPVIEDSSGNPISGEVGVLAHSDSSILTTVNPNQGPFDCVFDIEGRVLSADGDVELDVVDISQGVSPECGTGFVVSPFDLPWPGRVCLEDSGGDYTAWLHINVVELASWLQSYGSGDDSPGNENLWVRLTPSEGTLPIGPVDGAHVHDTIPGFQSGSLTIVGDYTAVTEIPLVADVGTGPCS